MKVHNSALLLVFFTVVLNIFSAVILKEAVDLEQVSFLVVAALIAAVISVNFFRVHLWGVIHRRYRLSDSYPLTSLFFPLILLVGLLYGEEVQPEEIIGTILITIGVLILSSGPRTSN